VVKPESASGKVMHVRLSPDSHWLAYSAIDGNAEEVYVTSFPEGNGRWQISGEGGTFPVWRRDGREIYFLGLDATLHATQVNTQDNRFEVGNSQSLFAMRNVFAMGEPFDVSPDGKRFLVFNQPEGSSSPMLLVLNWAAELNK
jgi:eukaryotic-like serine/threonine-protein kinase